VGWGVYVFTNGSMSTFLTVLQLVSWALSHTMAFEISVDSAPFSYGKVFEVDLGSSNKTA
jgi:hypothetical protein